MVGQCDCGTLGRWDSVTVGQCVSVVMVGQYDGVMTMGQCDGVVTMGLCDGRTV